MTILCSCGGSTGPLLMFPRDIAFSSFVAGYLFNIAKFLSSGPSSRGELLAYAARELSTAHSCPSSCGNVAVGDEEQSHWSWLTVISFVVGFSAGSTLIGVAVLCCRRRQTHGVAPTRRGGGRMVD